MSLYCCSILYYCLSIKYYGGLGFMKVIGKRFPFVVREGLAGHRLLPGGPRSGVLVYSSGSLRVFRLWHGLELEAFIRASGSLGIDRAHIKVPVSMEMDFRAYNI